MTDLRQRAAHLWRRILTTAPDVIFGPEVSRLLDRNWADRLPQPGYMGLRYRRSGLVFVSMYPGAGPEGGLTDDDQRLYGVLERLRDADESAVCSLFDELTIVLAEIMQRWKICRNFVAPLLDAAGLDFSEVAFVNLMKWRISDKRGLTRLYELSWNHHTCDQIELLAPSRVIAIGSGAGQAFKKHYSKPVDFDFIPCVIGNNVGTAGRAALARIAGMMRP